MQKVCKLLRSTAGKVSAGLVVGIIVSAYSTLSLAQQLTAAAIQPPSPPWTRDLVIYEVAPKSFTSPKGPESGTLESLTAKLPYLQELGITGIWLAGYALADPKHFFNIWMCYASIEPDQIDPSLGTPAQFKSLIDEAHSRGIKVFLDVTTHGLVKESPVVRAHPEWFRGGTFGMIDFDWNGGHTDLDDWWVRVWSDYVTQYGVDGFRLDLGIHNRPDLWERIRQNAAAVSHPIVIFEESDSGVIPGVTDFSEVENPIFQTSYEINSSGMPVRSWSDEPDPILANDIPGFYSRKFGRTGQYKVEVQYEDGSTGKGDTDGQGILRVQLKGLDRDKVSHRYNDLTGPDPYSKPPAEAKNVPRADGLPDVELIVSNIATKPISNIAVLDDRKGSWKLNPLEYERSLAMEGAAPIVRLYVSTLAYGSSITLSIHDIGWGRSSHENPYTARGSRALFGYSFLFTPMIPLFMAGEEFNASFHALPQMSPDFFGAKDLGKGHMLYGSMLDWSEVDEPHHRSMLEDVKRMLAIRKQEAGELTPEIRGDVEPQLVAVPHRSDIQVPVPYMRWKDGTAIVVVANRNTEADSHLRLSIPLDKLGQPSRARYRVTDLWNGGAPKVYPATSLSDFSYTVKRDKTPRGGLGVFKIERIQ